MTKTLPKAERKVYKSSSKLYGLNQTTDEVSRYFIDIPKGTTWEECEDKIKKKCIKSIREAVENSKKH